GSDPTASAPALRAAVVQLALHEPSCSLAELVGVLTGACDEQTWRSLGPTLATCLAEELLLVDTPPPRLLHLLQLMLELDWVQAPGVVAMVEELVTSWLEEGHEGVPATLALLECTLRKQPRSLRLAGAPQLSRLLVDRHMAVKDAFPALAEETEAALCGQRAADSEGEGDGAAPGPVLFHAVEDLPTHGGAPEGLLPFAVLPTVVSDSRHMGLLVAGAQGILEEWDLDTGLRSDRLCVAEDADAAYQGDVVSLAAPKWSPPEVLVAAVNGVEDAGLAVLRREAEVWQLESPWPRSTEGTGWRHLARVSRAEFLQSSSSVLVMGQTSVLGSHEVGLYDVALPSPKPLTACLGHWDFVTDLCSISSQSFASVALDGSLLLWDLRSVGPSSKGGFGANGAPNALCSIAFCRQMLLTGGVQGELSLFDVRKLAEPLGHPPTTLRGAVVRLQLWPSEEQLVAAVASAEEGLSALTVGGRCGLGVLHAARFMPALEEPRLFYDVAAAGCFGAGPGSLLFGCSDGNLAIGFNLAPPSRGEQPSSPASFRLRRPTDAWGASHLRRRRADADVESETRLRGLALGWYAIQVEATVESMLAADDECQGNDQCALNALQFRANEGDGLDAASNETAELAAELNQTSKLWRLYHVTSPSIGPKILKEGFRSGHAGWCGAAIYFGNTAQETKWKAVGQDSHQGYLIEAMVDPGHVKKMPWNCYTSTHCIDSHPGLQGHVSCLSRHYYGNELRGQGYDSIVFNPGDGNEIVIYDKHRVKSMRHIPMP
ncbi:Copia protein, partial [Durusdinium trenchii]